MLGLLTHFNFVLILSHFIATYKTHSFLFPYPNPYWLLQMINIWDRWKKFIVARFDDSITTYDPSIFGVLLGTNNERDSSYFFLMNPYLSFKTTVFFSGEKLASYSYVSISLIFVHYQVSYSAYIFLHFF